ncbi:MarR family winged helix-turn-helix transcriptional regulator [Actinomycetospora straminea]|uniref:HTH marR-type domain-containing protein n=1 Tax=Actinomycetospora straminea TaxID=663607 RepID=A0ABP9EJ40_9PSEU|nr:MarR family winged helix-turn-helix transcriptional regulator [Actinomycetospora straminea]MDD7933170.1 MarR family winged helix-turn-helix transcriptional regulator [Actinomycetospora straminea]
MHELARRVRELIVATDSYRRTMAAAVGVSTTEAAVLGHLLHDGPQSPSVVAARAGFSPAAATSLLDRLEQADLVSRRAHPRDRRRLLVELTPRGRAAITSIFSMFSDDLRHALEHADPRLVADPELREAVTELISAMAAALRTRAGDASGVTRAVTEAVAGSATADAGSVEASGGADAP